MLINTEITMKWNASNRKHYESKGYIFTKYKDEFIINSIDLSSYSKELVTYTCDYCGEINQTKNADYIVGRKKIAKDSCKKCRYKKVKESNDAIYGMHPNKTLDVKEKVKKQNVEKYGVEAYTQTEDFKEKAKATNLKKYGVEYYQATDEFQEKFKQTHLDKYGVEHTFQNPLFLQKRIETFMKNYGVENPMQSPEIKEKFMQTLYQNGTAQSSSQQRYIYSLIGGELNYPIGNCFLDIAFPEEKIYIEYDGGGHDLQVKFGTITQDEFIKKERKRSFYLYRKGWKEMRIVSNNDKLPSDEIIKDFVDYAKSFLIAENFSIIFNLNTDLIKLNYKEEISFDNFIKSYRRDTV